MKKKTKMKTKNIIQRLCLFLFVLVLSAPAGAQTPRIDAQGTMLIKDAAEWKLFCNLVNGGQTSLNAKLEADVDLGTDVAMVGNSDNNYGGTFDGQGHSLSVNWSVRDDTAPFQYVNGATIRNLHTKGQITVSENRLSGLVYKVNGAATIANCFSEVNLTSHVTWTECWIAGMVVWVDNDAKVTITDCLVKGKFHATTEYGRKGMAGFVYAQQGQCTLTNCLYIGENNTTGEYSYTFSENATIKNCYYLKACGKTQNQGEQVTEAQLRNGEVTNKLQAGRTEQVWQQTAGMGYPLPFDKTKKKEYKVEFVYNGKVVITHTVKSGKTVTPPTVQEILGSAYNAQHFYTLTFSSGFTASTPITADLTVEVTIDERDYFTIASKEDWKKFCELVNGGRTKLDAKLMQDIDLGADIAMVGAYPNRYAGTFDGQNHTLTMNWNAGNTKDIAPFKKVKDATIRNLRTKGTITSSSYYLSGLIDEVYGKTTITGCISEVNITSSYNEGSSDVAGMISYIMGSDANITITDCIVKGNITATTDNGRKGMGGFVYRQGGTCTLTNCLYIGENNAIGGNTFADKATVMNCYYLNVCGTAQGEKITEEQLKNGYVAHQLQAGRTDYFWGQELGKDKEPQLTNETAKHVCKVEFTYNGEVKATRYVNNGKTVSLSDLTPKNILGEKYNPHHYYTLAFSGGFTETTPVTTDQTVVITVAEKEAYEIATKEDWKAFCDRVNKGQTTLNAKLTKDVDLGEEIVMAGTADSYYYVFFYYTGTFDGQGHTLSFNWNAGKDDKIALFKYVKDATIKNLRTQGKITSKGDGLSGMVYAAFGTTTISGCISDVDITGGTVVGMYPKPRAWFKL